MTLFFIIVAAIIVGHLALAVLITYPREIGIGLVSLVAVAIGVLYVMANPESVQELEGMGCRCIILWSSNVCLVGPGEE